MRTLRRSGRPTSRTVHRAHFWVLLWAAGRVFGVETRIPAWAQCVTHDSPLRTIPLTSTEEGAGDRCRDAIDKALQFDPEDPEALQLMASYLFSVEKPQVPAGAVAGWESPRPSH